LGTPGTNVRLRWKNPGKKWEKPGKNGTGTKIYIGNSEFSRDEKRDVYNRKIESR
jgi:hypothetical protein